MEEICCLGGYHYQNRPDQVSISPDRGVFAVNIEELWSRRVIRRCFCGIGSIVLFSLYLYYIMGKKEICEQTVKLLFQKRKTYGKENYKKVKKFSKKYLTNGELSVMISQRLRHGLPV